VFFDSCCQNIAAFFRKRRKNSNYLLDSFAGTVNDLRKTTTNLAMMVNTCKAQVFIRQMLQALQSLINSNVAVFDFF